MSKKDQLKHLSDEDKILWYELHSNPTGSDSSDLLFEVIIWLIIVAAIIAVVHYLKS